MSDKRNMGDGLVKRILQESHPQYDKASEESDQELWLTYKVLNFHKTRITVYRNSLK